MKRICSWYYDFKATEPFNEIFLKLNKESLIGFKLKLFVTFSKLDNYDIDCESTEILNTTICSPINEWFEREVVNPILLLTTHQGSLISIIVFGEKDLIQDKVANKIVSVSNNLKQ